MGTPDQTERHSAAHHHIPKPFVPFLTYLSLAAIALYSVALPMMKFAGKGYRGDEAWDVYRSMNALPRVVLLILPDVKPPLYHLTLSGWIRLFGHHEVITRHLSSLFLLLTLAFTYQIGRTLFGRVAGLWTALLLGLVPLVQHYAHEANTYSLLLMGTTGTSAALLLWLTTGKRHYSVFYVVLGIILVYTHYYGVYVVLAQAGFVALFVTWQRGMLLRAFTLFAAVGAAFTLGWGLVVLHTLMGYSIGGGEQFISGSLYAVLEHLYNRFESRPTGVLTIAVLLGVTTAYTHTERPPLQHMRWGSLWRKGFPLTVAGLILLLALALNAQTQSLTDRNLIVMLPFICAIGAFGLVSSPRRLQGIILLLLVVAGYTTYWKPSLRRSYIDMTTYMARDYRLGDAIFIDIPYRTGQIASTYYVRERQHNAGRVPPEDVYHIVDRGEYRRMAPFFPQPLGNVITNREPGTMAEIRRDLAERERVWYFQIDVQAQTPMIQDTIGEAYAVGYTANLSPDFYATLWRRVPDLNVDYRFGEVIKLYHWALLSGYEVRPCDTLHLESWWRADDEPRENYSLGVKMLAPDGTLLAAEDNQLSLLLTRQWEPGRFYIDDSYIAVPCDAPPGQYDIILLVYDPDTPDDALPVTLPGGGADPVGTWAYLTSVQVTSPQGN